jgi:hypothetical protein
VAAWGGTLDLCAAVQKPHRYAIGQLARKNTAKDDYQRTPAADVAGGVMSARYDYTGILGCSCAILRHRHAVQRERAAAVRADPAHRRQGAGGGETARRTEHVRPLDRAPIDITPSSTGC